MLAACGGRGGAPPRPAPLFSLVPLATGDGLSGLTTDEHGVLWTVSERALEAYSVTLDDDLTPTITTFRIEGVPDDTELEAIESLGGGRFAFGTEGDRGGLATVLFGELRGRVITMTRALELPAKGLGVTLRRNEGVEGVCGAGTALVASIEAVGTDGGRRWAPIVAIDHGAIVRTHRLFLTTATGKLSGLDCTLDGTTLTIRAIERHFAVTRVLEFRLTEGQRDIEATVLLDLGPVLQGTFNLEGLAHLADGRLVAVVDNHWKRVTGKNLLLVFAKHAR